jgi:glycosyltransferase involved in cell wall biosynthesis
MTSFTDLGINCRTISFGPKTSSGISLVFGYAVYMVIAFITLLTEIKRRSVEVVMSLGGHTYSGFLVTLAGRLMHRKSIVRFAGPTRKTLRLRYRIGLLYSIIAGVIERWVFSNCGILLSNSPLTGYVEKENELHVFVISQGVDQELFKSTPEPRTSNLQPRLVTVARLSKEKNIDSIILATRILADKRKRIKLEIVGDGPERAFLESIVNDHDLANRVKFHGYIDQTNIPSILSNSDVFVLPSFVESLPSAMLEAMACRVPVVVSEHWISNIPEFKKGHSVISCDGSPEGIADAVLSLLDDASLRNRLVKNAYQTVLQHHTVSKTRSKFRKLVVDIVSSLESG